MNVISHNADFIQNSASNLMPRAVVILLVIFAHLAVLSVWSTQHGAQPQTTNPMSVSFSMTVQAPQPAITHTREIPPVPVALPEHVAEQPVATEHQETAVASPVVASAAPVIADTEPDYKASYLNNPPPAYPMVARRNGMQGRVMLKVEVLADGLCGQINIHQSSGYPMLDNAALQTVRNWRFTPARHAGQKVDRWFMIPIQFSLKDSAA